MKQKPKQIFVPIIIYRAGSEKLQVEPTKHQAPIIA